MTNYLTEKKIRLSRFSQEASELEAVLTKDLLAMTKVYTGPLMDIMKRHENINMFAVPSILSQFGTSLGKPSTSRMIL